MDNKAIYPNTIVTLNEIILVTFHEVDNSFEYCIQFNVTCQRTLNSNLSLFGYIDQMM